MTTKSRTLRLLEESQGDYVSGVKLASALGVSRNAVWKAVNALREEGYDIAATTNKGYRLSQDSDLLSPVSIGRFLPAGHPFDIVLRKRVTSTNTEAQQLALLGAPEGTVVVAEEQTAGKGRRGKSFFSPASTGIYLSIVLRPLLQANASACLTAAAAVACAQAIEAVTGRKTAIKWINDIFCDGRKVVGILTEGALSVESGRFEYAVLGIGINVKPPSAGFPSEMADVAGALCPVNADPLRSKLAAEVLARFWGLYENLDSRSFYSDYRDRCFLLDQPIVITRRGQRIRARAVDLTEDFQLVIELPDKTRENLQYGEVSTARA
ncbi:MAG: biotin--[acetyl-CoA-carboxylase] ligase [Gordonibacter sp.]|uniref:biotin--[acetyl-CoA-carboxylase] ligase n=1 Tax=Gordonibacter sp. TaxID=1968902 RepID=UPI002FC6D499